MRLATHRRAPCASSLSHSWERVGVRAGRWQRAVGGPHESHSLSGPRNSRSNDIGLLVGNGLTIGFAGHTRLMQIMNPREPFGGSSMCRAIEATSRGRRAFQAFMRGWCGTVCQGTSTASLHSVKRFVSTATAAPSPRPSPASGRGSEPRRSEARHRSSDARFVWPSPTARRAEVPMSTVKTNG